MHKTIKKAIIIVATNTATIEIKKGTQFYDNGKCVQVSYFGHWYVVSKPDWESIQMNFQMVSEKDNKVLFTAYTFTIV